MVQRLLYEFALVLLSCDAPNPLVSKFLEVNVMRKRSLMVLAFVAAALTACDAGRESSRVAGPQQDFLAWTGTPVTTAEASGESVVTAVIGSRGGQIQNGAHTLVVPRRAVSGDTEFTFRMVGGNNIHADLTAKSVATGAAVTQFATPLTLMLSYRGADVQDPSRLAIVWLVDGSFDGRKEKMTSFVDVVGQVVYGSLPHFSEYGMGWQ